MLCDRCLLTAVRPLLVWGEQELGVQIEEPFSIIAIESIFDSAKARELGGVGLRMGETGTDAETGRQADLQADKLSRHQEPPLRAQTKREK